MINAEMTNILAPKGQVTMRRYGNEVHFIFLQP
jgi:hypothetical protein